MNDDILDATRKAFAQCTPSVEELANVQKGERVERGGTQRKALKRKQQLGATDSTTAAMTHARHHSQNRANDASQNKKSKDGWQGKQGKKKKKKKKSD